MIGALGQTLGLAVGIAIFPVPIVAMIAMLFAPSPGRKVSAFVAGWLLGLTTVGVLALAAGIGSDAGNESGNVARIIVGGLLIFLSVRKWMGRPGPGEQPQPPAWMAALGGFGPGKSFGLGLLLSAVNPKNFGLTVAAVASIGSADLGTGQEAAALLIFVAVASLGVVTPAAAYLLARERVKPMLKATRQWLDLNGATVMTVLFLVLGAVILGQGISGSG